ncbi:MAG TPA: hypothetical protein VKF40_11585 [Burkholderiales bacterium]|nr:hypothetical protein [Burkholderiales bacterium]
MSQWWRDRLGVELGPAEVVIARVGRGLRRRSADVRRLRPPQSDDARDWREAVAALDAEIASAQWRNADLIVCPSDHFVHYDVLPWSDELRSEEEVRAFARHRLRETYGEGAEAWMVALSLAWPGQKRLVAAMEQALVEALAEVAVRHQLRLAEVKPRFTALLDGCRRALSEKSFWFAAAEPGRLALARAWDGEWQSLASTRDGGDAGQALCSLLVRESFAVDSEAATRRIYAHELPGAVAEKVGEAGWEIVPVSPRWNWSA